MGNIIIDKYVIWYIIIQITLNRGLHMVRKKGGIWRIEKIQKGRPTYYYEKFWHKEVAELLDKKPKDDKAIEELESLAKRVDKPLRMLIGDYLVGESKKDRLKAAEWFNVFKRHLSPFLCLYFSLMIEGYPDLQFMGLQGSFKKYPRDFRFLKSIKYGFQFDNPLLIIGETGTSKEAVAHVIHNLSSRRCDHPFYEINCAAIPETMLEDELFGHEKGAFTDAHKMKKGRLEIAKGGTIFLDELGKMPPRLQAKILKVVEEKKVSRIGSEEKEPIDIDVRFIAAVQPNDLEKNILPDLRYRMGYPDVINMPTLNERLKYVSRFVLQGSLKKAADTLGVKIANLKLTGASFKEIMSHNFEGNYRELENIFRYAIKEAVTEELSLEEWVEDLDKKQSDKPIKKAVEKKVITIEPKHFLELLNASGDTGETENLKASDDLEHIKLKDIIEYADNLASAIIERKVCETKRRGKTVRQALAQEGLSNMQYQNLIKKIRQRTGKGIRDMKTTE